MSELDNHPVARRVTGTDAELKLHEVDLCLVAPSDPLDDVSGSHFLFTNWLADLPDPDNVLRHSDFRRILRRVGWQDPELDDWLDRAAHMPDRAGRMTLYRQADRRLVLEQALIVPVVCGLHRELSQPWLCGGRPDKMGRLSLKDVVVEKHASD